MNIPPKIFNWKMQKGYAMWQWVFFLLIAAFFMLLAFRLIPLYTENQFIKAGLKDLVKLDENLLEMTDAEIRKRMDNYYLVNNVRTQKSSDIEIDRDDDRVVVMIDYEAKANLFTDQPLLGTVDLVVTFKNHLDSRSVRECCEPLKDK